MHLTFSPCCALYLPDNFPAHSGESNNLGFQENGTKCRQLVRRISKVNFSHWPVSKADFFMNLFLCGLKVFMTVMVIRLGIYMAFSFFKVLFSQKTKQKNLRVCFKSIFFSTQ